SAGAGRGGAGPFGRSARGVTRAAHPGDIFFRAVGEPRRTRLVRRRLPRAGSPGRAARREDPPRRPPAGHPRRNGGPGCPRHQSQDGRIVRSFSPSPSPLPRGCHSAMRPATVRGRLFRKYAAVLILLVGGVLLVSSVVNLVFSYRQTKAALARVQRQQVLAAANRIEQFVSGIERQGRAAMEGAFTDAATGREQRETDFLRLLRDTPAINEIVQLDAAGKVQLLVSRFAPNESGSQRDLSGDSRFVKTRIGRAYFGPVSFRNESEPSLDVAVPW